MTPQCPGCGGAATTLAVSYRYPRAEPLYEAADPWNVQGSAPMRACGSVACEAAALLAVIDTIVTDVAVDHGHLIEPGDVRIVWVGRAGRAPFMMPDP